MDPEEDVKIRFADLDDVPRLKEVAGEKEIRTKYLHESVRARRQKVILLEKSEDIKGFLKIRIVDEGIKIDFFKLPEDQEQINDLLSTVEALAFQGKVYTYIPKEDEALEIFKDAGYEGGIETDDNKVKVSKEWSKIHEDREKEKQFYDKVKEVSERYKVLQPASVYKGTRLERNLKKLENKMEEIEKEEEDKVKCTECDRVFDSEKGMKIHKTKVHG